MKKLWMMIMVAGTVIACNNGQTSNEKHGEDVDPYGHVGVENVNGNIPDTTNTIDLNPSKTDSTQQSDTVPAKDTLKKNED